MPKLICVDCECELGRTMTGILVIEMASFGVYRVWSADVMTCPRCKTEIVAGFGREPMRQDHYAPDFPEWLEEQKASARRIVYDKEPPF